jgi:hypothetical protein
MSFALSKSRFVRGWYCPNWLWWSVHEPDAPELQPDSASASRMRQGNLVGQRACEEFPGGVLIDFPHDAYDEKIEATRRALAEGAPAIFEASFREDGVFAAVDILERVDGGHNVIEVKSGTSIADKHIPDIAVQAHVVRAAGLEVRRCELMHLNREHRHPHDGPLFVREDVSDRVADIMDRVPAEIAAQIEVLNGPAPDLALGHQCTGGHGCPFRSRCWPQEPDSVNRLHNMWMTKKLDLMNDGVELIVDVPDQVRLNVIQTRQREALRAGRMIVEAGLGAALDAFEYPIGFLDFETMQRALPPYDGLWPWAQLTAQFSYHEQAADGGVRHVEWLADEFEDPRDPLARAMIEACRDARVILVYHAPFESTRIKELAEALPDLADDLVDIRGRLFDLKKIVMDNVYHPDFEGSFGLKTVLPVLVPDLGYDDLEIQGGGDAMVDIARLLLEPESFAPGEREQLRTDLLAYCERDTLAMVRLLERLRELAGPRLIS